MRTNLKENKGITLVALVITIVVLLILAGVAIATLSGENNIITKSREAREKHEIKANEEEIELANYEAKIEEYTGKNKTTSNVEYYLRIDEEKGTEWENLIVVDYANNLIKTYSNGLKGENLSNEYSIEVDRFANENITIDTEDEEVQEISVTGATTIYATAGGNTVMYGYIKDGKLYEAGWSDNGDIYFEQDLCYSLTSNSIASRLVDE